MHGGKGHNLLEDNSKRWEDKSAPEECLKDENLMRLKNIRVWGEEVFSLKRRAKFNTVRKIALNRDLQIR